MKNGIMNIITKLFSVQTRFVIVHVHIFKNAGTTLDWVFAKNFGNDFHDHRDDESMVDGGRGYLRRYIVEHSKVKAISSHHIYFNPASISIPRTRVIPVYIIRHPIERILSVYKFERKQKSSAIGPTHAKMLDFNDFVDWRMSSEEASTIVNANSIYCSGHRGVIGEIEYLLAKNNLTNTPLVAVVDRFTESMEVFKKFLVGIYPCIDLSYTRQNVGQPERKSLEEKILEVEGLLSEDVKQKIYSLNEYDLKLYDFANTLLGNRLELNKLKN